MIDIKEELTCVVCFDYFNDPVTLFCGHSFCKNCIRGVVLNTSKCPFCQSIILSSNFQINFVLKKIIDKHKHILVDEDDTQQINKEKQKKPDLGIQKILALNLKEHKFTFDGTLYKVVIEFKKSRALFNDIMKDKYFAILSNKYKNLASILKLESINGQKKNSITLIGRCQKRVKIECIENLSLTNGQYYIENGLLQPNEKFELQILNYQEREQLSNDLTDIQKKKLDIISQKVTKLFAKLKKNNPYESQVLQIRHQVHLVHEQMLNIQYQDNVQNYIEFLSQLLLLSQEEKEKLYLGESLDEKINIIYDFLEPITDQNDPVFVFYIIKGTNSLKPFLVLLCFILFLIFKFWIQA